MKRRTSLTHTKDIHDTLYVYIVPKYVDKSRVMKEKAPHHKLGDRIRKLLDDSKISQRELARKLKVGPNQVSRWVLGNVAPTYTVLNDIIKLSRQPHLSGWLLSGKGEGTMEQKQDISSEEYTADQLSKHEKEMEMLKDKLIAVMEEKDELRKEVAELKAMLAEQVLAKSKPLARKKMGQ
jgi:transcriptional regulator with XRE-family HTH domain